MWAASWWEYAEAAIRLEILWRAWKKLRQDPSTDMTLPYTAPPEGRSPDVRVPVEEEPPAAD